MATILIVDDRAPNREFLVTLLGYGGHRLLEAADGAAALALARAERPDLILTDLLMPTMDGYELVRQLRADPAVAATRVIFCTAHYHEPEARKLAAACGVEAVLIKPCEPETVLRAVDAALGHAPAPAVPPAAVEFDREHVHLLTDKLSQKADELRRTNGRLTALVELGMQLGSERDPGRLLQQFCHAAREIIGARCAVVGIPGAGNPPYRFLLTSGLDAAAAALAARLGPLAGVLGSVLAGGHCFRTANHSGLEATGVPACFPAARALLAAPLLSPARVHGWVCLLDKVGADAFTAEDEQIARMLGGQVGRIYENGSLYLDLMHHAARLADEVTERKRAEAEARRSADLLRAVAAGTTDAVFVKDRDGRYLLFNEAAARFVGQPVAAVLGQDDTAVFDAASARQVMAGDRAVMTSGVVQTDEETLTAAGVTRTYHVTKGPYRDEHGNVIGVLGISRDITDRKQAEADLRLRDRAIQAVNQGIVITDPNQPDNPIIFASPGFERLTGYQSAEVVGRNCRFLQGKETDPAAVVRLREAVRAGAACTVELRNYRKDGSAFWNELSISPVRDEHGRLVHFVGVQADVTARHSLEEQYRHAQKMEAVGRLAGGVAHDFNNLLTIIKGYSQLVAERLPTADANRPLVQEVLNAGERAATLTRQLLAFSRKAILAPQVLNLKNVVADVQHMLTRIVGEDIHLTVAADPDVGAVLIDPGQIEQVIMNLVVNARDAMPTGGRLTIAVANAPIDAAAAANHPDARAGAHVRLTVSDTGCGMDAATIARAFEPFFTTKGEHGTGLGLATVHAIVQRAGGHVQVASTVGRGTTFTVYLPLVQSQLVAPKGRSNPAVRPRGGETILLVEDDDSVRALADLLLRDCGYTVLATRDGADAVRLASEHAGRIDLLVTDVVMPRMDGRAVADRLRTLQPGIKVLFLSGYTDDAVVRHGVHEAAVAFLQKPFTPHALTEKVREVLDGPATTDTA